MTPNPALLKLGFSETDRVVIFHTDDIGMCQASVDAFAELDAFGLISSGAVMVPCPWFLEAARYQVENPRADLGVHLTLTSEWKTYRWGPISTRDPQSGLMDEQGYFPHRSHMVQASADPTAAAVELEAQIKRAFAAGMRPTHIDTHMGSVAHPKFMGAYLQLAMRYGLPPMIFRLDEAGWRAAGLDAVTAVAAVQQTSAMEAAGVPLLDNLVGMPLDDPTDRLELATRLIRALKPGITHFILHPSKDTPELRSITHDWRFRAADLQVFSSPELQQVVKQEGIQVIGYRALQALMPSQGVAE